jgi:hypothetical protein
MLTRLRGAMTTRTLTPYDSQTREFWSYEAKFTDGQCVEIACIEYEKPTQDNGYKTE